MSSQQPGCVIFDNYAAHKQTFIIPLTFLDITEAKDIITRIGYGGDVWEMRVDLLSPTPLGAGNATNLPPLNYVRDQLKALQSMSPLPILYTIRTSSQGGRLPDDRSQEALDLMLLAVDMNVAYIDVEIEWPQTLLDEISAKKGSSKIVASYHSWTGKVAWTSQELLDKFHAANSFGDIIKLSILAAQMEDCAELSLFVRDYRRKYTKPILAVGMGANGQLSRITNPISLVTHPLIPFPSAPGQLSLAQVNRALSLIGQLPKQEVLVSGNEPIVGIVAGALDAAFTELGYPHKSKTGINDGATSLDVRALKTLNDVISSVAESFTRVTGRPAPLSVIRDSLASWPQKMT